MDRKRPSGGVCLTFVVLFSVFTLPHAAQASATETPIYSFLGGSDGNNPSSGLIFDGAGNLYGVTYQGGASGNGTVFELKPASGGWNESILYTFAGGGDGSVPYGGLVFDGIGNLYGTTQYGGAAPCGNCGTVFELSPIGAGGWTKQTLHSFQGTAQGGDGEDPVCTLVFDKSGDLFGTTESGGANGRGTVFELSPENGVWTETVIYNFSATESRGPLAGLIFDAAGNLYGTTTYGGSIFKLTQTAGVWTETVLHNFSSSDGTNPTASLIFDSSGNLYGTATQGGAYGHGTVFEFSPSSGSFTKLYDFQGGNDGNDPYGNLVFDKSGNLYGATSYGGSGPCNINGLPGCGTVFQLFLNAGAWTEHVLYTFTGGSDGSIPQFGLVLDSSGNLYGSAGSGGNQNGACLSTGCGVVFEITGISLPLFSFPLKGTTQGQDVKLNPWTAPVITVFDHSMADTSAKYKIYGFDGTVAAFTSEVGECSFTPPPPSCPGKRDGYYDSSITSFGVNGHYVGASDDGSALKLQYEGHPGFDYQATCTPNSRKPCKLGTGTNVYAAAAGVIHYPSTMVGLCSGQDCAAKYHAMELILDNLPYLVFYLHLSTYPGAGTITATDPSPAPGCPSTVVLPLAEGAVVGAGCLIAESGNTAPPPGVYPHLHFEIQAILPPAGLPPGLSCQVNGVRMACVPVDPYGWSCGSDPYFSLLQVANVSLWNYTPYLSASAVCFGQQTIGESVQQSVTLTNVAISTLKLKPATISGVDAVDFAETTACPATLMPGQSCQLTITFTPGASGARIASLTISGKDAGGAVRLVINLTGTGG
jgi:uncharacterized repeat protein (TIGR03803 family)